MVPNLLHPKYGNFLRKSRMFKVLGAHRQTRFGHEGLYTREERDCAGAQNLLSCAVGLKLRRKIHGFSKLIDTGIKIHCEAGA